MVGYEGQQDIEQARTKLAEFAAEANARKVKTEIIIAEGLAAEEILKTAGENESDLVVITVRRKGLMERTLLGTTAERVIRESNVPVLSIPATLES
jgi:nucleotide-binding universal stress UspA family protein